MSFCSFILVQSAQVGMLSLSVTSFRIPQFPKPECDGLHGIMYHKEYMEGERYI